MNLNFETPNKEAVGWLDTYFQFQDNERLVEKGNDVAYNYYDSNYDGWDKQPEANVRKAFYALMTLKEEWNITDEMINNQ